MSWFNVDDRAHNHPKLRRCSFAALGLWVVAGAYSSDYHTDGWVPAWFPESQRRSPDDDVAALSGELVEAGLWEECPDSERGPGWRMHDYADWNRTSAQITEAKEKEKARKEAARARMQKEREDAQRQNRTRKATQSKK